MLDLVKGISGTNHLISRRERFFFLEPHSPQNYFPVSPSSLEQQYFLPSHVICPPIKQPYSDVITYTLSPPSLKWSAPLVLFCSTMLGLLEGILERIISYQGGGGILKIMFLFSTQKLWQKLFTRILPYLSSIPFMIAFLTRPVNNLPS